MDYYYWKFKSEHLVYILWKIVKKMNSFPEKDLLKNVLNLSINNVSIPFAAESFDESCVLGDKVAYYDQMCQF